MKSIIILLTALLLNTGLKAQTVIVKPLQERLGTKKHDGFVSRMHGDEGKITQQWKKHLRKYGRLRIKGHFYTIHEAPLEGLAPHTVQLYTKVSADGDQSSIWLSALMDDKPADSIALINERLKDLLFDFSLNYYQEVAQRHVEEAERALSFTEKKHRKLVNEEVELHKDLESLKTEIIRLEELIEKGHLEEKVIHQKIIDNKANQDSTLIDIEHLKKVVVKKMEEKDAIK